MPLISFDLQDKYYDAIKRALDQGEWRTISEAIRTMVKEFLSQEKYAHLFKKEENVERKVP